MLSSGKITENIGKTVLSEMFRTGDDPKEIVDKKDLKPIQDSGMLESILDSVISSQQEIVNRIKSGETKLLDFLVGQVMKETRGKADPKRVRELITKKFMD